MVSALAVAAYETVTMTCKVKQSFKRPTINLLGYVGQFLGFSDGQQREMSKGNNQLTIDQWGQ